MANSVSEINFKIKLDENNIPENIKWQAEDNNNDLEETKAVLISIWDSRKKETLKMDLWTKDMPLEEMKHFFHQTLLSMADTFQRATNDDKMSDTLRDFCDYFAEKQNIK